jgi:CO/xanthine dehydrogenase Mo-binding subunit
MAELTVIGKPVQRVDAEDKITGQAVYGYDLVLPNMLYGKTLFSTKAHAKIKKIDTSKAQSAPRRRCSRYRRRRAVDSRGSGQRQTVLGPR